MSNYKPYPLLDFEGIRREKEPWLEPSNAWETMRDGYVYRGRMMKRPGYAYKQLLGIPLAAPENVGGLTQACAGTLANTPVVAPSKLYADFDYSDVSIYALRFTATWASGTMNAVAEPVFHAPYPPGGEGYARILDVATGSPLGICDYVTGVFNFTWPQTPTVQPTATYEYAPQNPVMYFYTHIAPDGSEFNLCFDTKRAWVMDNTEERYYCTTDSGDVNIWSGDETNPFWARTFGDICIITNGVDAPKKYDPSGSPVIQDAATNFDGTPGNDIQSAKMFVSYLGYGVYLGTKEGGAWYNGRARWTQNGNAEAFNDANDFLDAPSNDVIVSSGMVAGDLFVGMRDTGWWRFEATNDPFDPFRWVPIQSDKGSIAQNGTVEFQDRLISRSRYGLSAINRIGQADAAPELGDLPLSWSAEEAYLTQAVRYDAKRQAWWSYCAQGDATPQHVLALQIDQQKRAFSLYTLPFNAYGWYRASGIPTMDSISTVMDEITYGFDSAVLRGGFPTIVAGDTTGSVYAFEGTAYDEVGGTAYAPAATNTAVQLAAKSTKINPSPGLQMQLGYVDVLCSTQANGLLQLKFYANYESAPYKTVSIELDSSVGAGKILRRVPVNATALFHSVELVEETTSAVAIDSLILWLKPVAEFREIG